MTIHHLFCVLPRHNPWHMLWLVPKGKLMASTYIQVLGDRIYMYFGLWNQWFPCTCTGKWYNIPHIHVITQPASKPVRSPWKSPEDRFQLITYKSYNPNNNFHNHRILTTMIVTNMINHYAYHHDKPLCSSLLNHTEASWPKVSNYWNTIHVTTLQKEHHWELVWETVHTCKDITLLVHIHWKLKLLLYRVDKD